MTMNQWHWLVAAEIVVAAGVVGEASGQSGWLPRPQETSLIPETKGVASSEQVCGPRCTPPGLTFWHRCKGRLEKLFVCDEPDAVPLGQSMYQTYTNHVDQGIAARMILNDFDFEPAGANLNLRGQDKLPHIAALALRYPYRVVVERTDYSPGLADLRRQAVLKELNRRSIPLAADRVVVGLPLTPGLSGVEAFYLYGNLIEQTKSKGDSGGGADTGGTTGRPAQSNQTPGNR